MHNGRKIEHRKRGGSVEEKEPVSKEPLNREEKKEVARKRGGFVPGKASASRPDRRARGGATGPSPFSAAGKMSTMDYEKGSKTGVDEGGKGPDKDALRQ